MAAIADASEGRASRIRMEGFDTAALDMIPERNAGQISDGVRGDVWTVYGSCLHLLSKLLMHTLR